MLIDIRDAWARPGTMCVCIAISGILAMSRVNVCVDLSLYPSGILMEIGLLCG